MKSALSMIVKWACGRIAGMSLKSSDEVSWLESWFGFESWVRLESWIWSWMGLESRVESCMRFESWIDSSLNGRLSSWWGVYECMEEVSSGMELKWVERMAELSELLELEEDGVMES